MFNTIKIGLIVLLIIIAGGLGYYVSNLRKELAIQEFNNTILNQALEDQQKIINNQIQDINQIKLINKNLLIIKKAQNTKIQELRNKFSKTSNDKKRDFGDISRKKPELVKKIINKASTKAARCLEISTGAELKEGEKYEDCN